MIAQTVETSQLTLRRPNPGDWHAWHDYFASDRALGNGGPHGPGKSWRGFAATLGHWEIHGFGLWVVTLTGNDTAIGLVGGFYPADWPEKEIGWMIFSSELEGKGIAHEAATAAITHAFETLGWKTAVSYIAADNARSIALAERLGAQLDPDARIPRPDDPCLVYRHPAPGGAA